MLCNEKCLYLMNTPVRTAGTVWFNFQTALPSAGAVSRELRSITDIPDIRKLTYVDYSKVTEEILQGSFKRESYMAES